jgi:hypothetical protein
MQLKQKFGIIFGCVLYNLGRSEEYRKDSVTRKWPPSITNKSVTLNISIIHPTPKSWTMTEKNIGIAIKGMLKRN